MTEHSRFYVNNKEVSVCPFLTALFFKYIVTKIVKLHALQHTYRMLILFCFIQISYCCILGKNCTFSRKHEFNLQRVWGMAAFEFYHHNWTAWENYFNYMFWIIKVQVWSQCLISSCTIYSIFPHLLNSNKHHESPSTINLQ